MKNPEEIIYVVTIIRWADHENEKIYEQFAFTSEERAVKYLRSIYNRFHVEGSDRTRHSITIEPWRKSFEIDGHDWRLSGIVRRQFLWTEEDMRKLQNL